MGKRIPALKTGTKWLMHDSTIVLGLSSTPKSVYLFALQPDLLFLGSAYLVEPGPAPIFGAWLDQFQAALQILFGSSRLSDDQHAVCLEAIPKLGMGHNPRSLEF